MDKKTKREEKEKQVEAGDPERREDSTKYGEFVSSFFSWVSLSQQKEKAEKLEEITKNKDNNK